jgi:hypothetical protein
LAVVVEQVMQVFNYLVEVAAAVCLPLDVTGATLITNTQYAIHSRFWRNAKLQSPNFSLPLIGGKLAQPN